MSFPRYPAYKDSGAEWLGQVPEHWDVVPLKSIATVINGYPFDSKLFDPEEGFPLIRIRDLNQSTPDAYYKGQFIDAAAIDNNDVLVGMDGDFNVGRWLGQVPALLNQRMCCVRSATPLITRYLRYVLPTPLKQINDITYSTTVKHLSSYDVLNLRLTLPRNNLEILQIVNCLDRETAKIDALIAEQQRLIELLQEKRQAVISHAVTKGLNPDAPMKDSGVEWLGEVPEHWSVSAVGHRYEVRLGKMLDEKRVTGEHLGPYLRNTDVQWESINIEELPEMDFEPSEHERYSLREGDLLVCEGGEVGRSAIWQSQLSICFYQKALHRLRPLNPRSDNSLFQLYVMRMACSLGVFEASSGKATINHLPAESFRRYRFAYPPLAEQISIADNLSQACSQLNELEAEAQSLVSTLQERRSALISAAVTGQIDVRGLVAEASAA